MAAELGCSVTAEQWAVKATLLFEPGLARALCSCKFESNIRTGSTRYDCSGSLWDGEGRLLTWIAYFWVIFSFIVFNFLFFLLKLRTAPISSLAAEWELHCLPTMITALSCHGWHTSVHAWSSIFCHWVRLLDQRGLWAEPPMCLRSAHHCTILPKSTFPH